MKKIFFILLLSLGLQASYNPQGIFVWYKIKKLNHKYDTYSLYLILNTPKIGYSNGKIYFVYPMQKRWETTWQKANNYCKTLDFEGLKWRLPTKKEAYNWYKYGRLYTYKYGGRNVFIQKKGYTYDIERNHVYKPDFPKGFYCVPKKGGLKYKYPLMKVAKDIFLMYEKRVKSLSKPLPKPKKPIIEKFSPPKKGEFEKTKDYKKRVAKEKSIYETKKQEKLKQYEEVLKNWRYKNGLIKKYAKEQSNILKNMKNKLEAGAVGMAMFIKYGSPKIINVKYDADKEQFDMDIVSSRVDKIYVKDSSKLRNATRAKNIMVFNTDNELIITIKNPYPLDRFQGVDLQRLGKFDYLAVGSKNVFDNELKFANIHINKGAQIDIFLPKSEDKGFYSFGKFLFTNNTHYHVHGSIKYDKSIKSKTKVIKKYKFKKHITVKVPLKYARLFKETIQNHRKFQPKIMFEANGKNIKFKYVKNFKDMNAFIQKLIFDDAYNDVEKLKKYISSHKDSKYYKKAQKRLLQLERFYKGYTPKMPFYVEGCKGYYPSNLISIHLDKFVKNPKEIIPDFWDKITWSGLCRKGLLSGSGKLKMSTADGRFYITIEGKMKEGFFTGKVERDISKHKSSVFWNSDNIEKDIKLDSYKDFQNYQSGL